MLDRELIRSEPDRIKAALSRRDPSLAEQIDHFLALDLRRRQTQTRLDELRNQRNQVSKSIGKLKREGKEEEAQAAIARSAELGREIGELEEELARLDEELRGVELSLPNLPADEVPDGATSEEGKIIKQWGELPQFSHEPADYLTLMERHGLIDTEAAARTSGHAFYFLRGAGARLQRALIQFMLDLHTRLHGYTELYSPHLVRGETMVGTGQLPKFAEDMYKLEGEDLWLIPTAEVSVTNYFRETIIDDPLTEPIKFVCHTPCYRREAGSYGKEVRGLLRVHQFEKVELVNFTHPDQGREQLEVLTAEAEAVLEKLGLAYRRKLLPAGDMTFGSAMTYDLEVWLPATGAWSEVSSASWYRDFQARRARIRFRPSPGAKPQFVHTLNASGLALPRLIAAIVESGQREDGSIALPAALEPYFGSPELVPAPALEKK